MSSRGTLPLLLLLTYLLPLAQARPVRHANRHGLAIGLGVGIPLLLIALAAIIYCVFRWRQDDEDIDNAHNNNNINNNAPLPQMAQQAQGPFQHPQVPPAGPGPEASGAVPVRDMDKTVYAGRDYDSRPVEGDGQGVREGEAPRHVEV